MYCSVVWLRSVLRATTAYTFATSEPPRMVRTPSVLDSLTSKCASRHNGVHFFNISTSKRGPRPPVFSTFDFRMCFRATTACTFFNIWTSKSGPNPSILYILPSKCASRHNGVHFFDISTSKSGPRPPVFNTFDLEMCFAPQRRALFSTSQLPKVVRDRQFLTLLTWKCASRHNGVHFFDIATSKSRPTLRCFAHFDFKMCFAPQRRALFRHLNFQKWSETASF